MSAYVRHRRILTKYLTLAAGSRKITSGRLALFTPHGKSI